MRIAREAWPFALPLLFASVALFALGQTIGGALAAALLLFVLYFFRDPKRSFEGPPDLLLAPADGTVLAIDEIEDPVLSELADLPSETKYRRIVTFLSVFNVHLQRTPCEGTVLGGRRKDGKYVAAYRGDADVVNAAYLTAIRRLEGDPIGVRQIVGLVARRIVPYLSQGDQIQRGDTLGLIKFGSRVDLVFPTSYDVMVEVGAKLQGGATAVAMPTDPSTNPVR